jgi:hypothetical protein
MGLVVASVMVGVPRCRFVLLLGHRHPIPSKTVVALEELHPPFDEAQPVHLPLKPRQARVQPHCSFL